jgi:hypothetical protein
MSFEVYNPLNEVNRLLEQVNAITIEASTAQSTSSNQRIHLTYQQPQYDFTDTGLLDILTGVLEKTIYDYTGGSINGILQLPYADTPANAASLISQFQISNLYPLSAIYITRVVSGGSTPITMGTFLPTFNYVKCSTIRDGILMDASSSITLWNPEEDQNKGYYIFILGLNFISGEEEVEIIASQRGPRPFTVTGCLYTPTQLFDRMDFIQTIHPDYNLSSWSFFGTLAGMSETYAFTYLIQQSIGIEIQSLHQQLGYVAAAAFNSATLKNYQILGGGSTVSPTITENPWSVSYTKQPILGNIQRMTMQLISGTFGSVNAQYKLYVTGILNLYSIEVICTDILGMINEGFGVNSFLPNWITSSQRSAIINQYAGNVASYLASGKDDMNYQGSYYFSMPLLRVDSFVIKDITTGTNVDVNDPSKTSVLWFDSVTQSYNASGLSIVKNISWNFFAIKFPDAKTALMITQITTLTSGTYYIASAYQENQSPIRWNMNNISIVGSNEWTSPVSQLKYYMTWTITLTNPATTVIIQTNWNEQEIASPSAQGHDIYKYEGIGTTQPGTSILGNTLLNGVVFMEISAAGQN